MTIRIMLMGLVASLGFELPSGSDVSRWAQAGSAWAQGRMTEQSGPEVEAKLDRAGLSDCRQAEVTPEVPSLVSEEEAEVDWAFRAVSEGMAADLAADLLASHRDEEPTRESGLCEAGEPASVGLPEGEEVGCLVVPADESSAAVTASVDEDMPDDSDGTTEVSPERTDRVSAAVRLTREAVRAWAGLMLQSDESCHPSR
jgi:hypothetical protein